MTEERGYPSYPKYPSTQDVNEQHGEMDIHYILSEIWGSKRTMLISFAAALVLGIMVALSLNPSYKTDALIQIRPRTPLMGMTSIADVLSSMSFTKGPMPAQAQVESTLVQSRYVLGHVVEEMGLDNHVVPKLFPLFGQLISKHYSGKSPAKPWFGLTKYNWGGAKLTLDKLSVSSSMVSNHARFRLVAGKKGHYSVYDQNGQLMLRGVAGELARSSARSPALTMQVNTLTARPGTEFTVWKSSQQDAVRNLAASMSIDKDTLRNSIMDVTYTAGSPDAAVNVLNKIVDTAYTLGLQQQANEADRIIGFLHQQIPMVKAQLESAENNLAHYQASSGNINMSAQTQVLLQQIVNVDNQVEQMKLRRTELLQKYTKTHPFVVTLDEKINQVEQEAKEQESHLRGLPEKDRGMVELVRDVKTKNALYMMLLDKAQELKLLKAGAVSSLTILDYAAVPPQMVPVRKSLIMMASGFVGIIIGLLIVFVRVMLRSGIQDPDAVEKELGVPTHGIVPYSPRQHQMEGEIDKGELLPGVSRVLARSMPSDIAIEAMRSLRTAVQLNLLSASNNIIAINGATPGIGKSFVSMNFAHVLSDARKRVLLIDADLRKGKLHEHLELDRMPGLTDFLQGTATLEEIVHTIDDGKLYFIPRGRKAESPSELLLQPELSELLTGLAKEFDAVVVDTAPVLVVADGAIVSAQAGTNLLVVGAGKNSMKEITRAVAMLKNNNVEPTATVFNYREKRVAGYGYYYNYGYKYYSSYQAT